MSHQDEKVISFGEMYSYSSTLSLTEKVSKKFRNYARESISYAARPPCLLSLLTKKTWHIYVKYRETKGKDSLINIQLYFTRSPWQRTITRHIRCLTKLFVTSSTKKQRRRPLMVKNETIVILPCGRVWINRKNKKIKRTIMFSWFSLEAILHRVKEHTV